MFYITVFLIVLLFLIVNQSLWNRKIDTFLSICFAILLIVLGTIRWKTGFDWGAYQGFYVYIRDYVTYWSDMKVSFEPIYTSFYFLAKFTGIGFVFVQFLQILLIVLIKYHIHKKYTPFLFLALFLNFCFFPDIVTVRNFLAATVVLFSLKFVEEKRPVAFLLTVIIATNIHVSSILSLLYYPLFHKRFSIGFKSLLIILSVVVGLSGIMELLLSSLTSSIGGGVGDKMSHYVEGEGGAEKGILGIIFGLARRLIIIPIVFYYEEKYFKNDKFFKGLSNLFIFGNIVYFLVGNGSLSIFQRMSIPFYLCEVLILVLIYQKTRVKSVFFLFIVLYGFSKFFFIYQTKTVKPYITIFNWENVKSEYWDKQKVERPFK